MATCIWTGKSGKKYEYTIYSMNTEWNDVPGNYIFTRETSPGSDRWEPIYIGQTESFKDRLPHHEELPCILRHGGTHVHAHVNGNKQARLTEESDLLANHDTPCK